MRREEESCFRQFVRLGNLPVKIQNHAAKRAKNEGAPGHVDENTDSGQMEPETNCPDLVAASTRQTVRSPEFGVRSPRAEGGNTRSEVRIGNQATSRISDLKSQISKEPSTKSLLHPMTR